MPVHKAKSIRETRNLSKFILSQILIYIYPFNLNNKLIMKDLLVIIIVFGVFIFTLYVNKQSNFDEKQQIITNNEPKTKIQKNKILDLINEKRSKIKNIKITSIVVHNKINRFNMSSSGYLFYEKNKNFRLVLNSIFGKELDIGSNDNYFWYWSKRSIEKGIFYSLHENIKSTRLKDPINPLFLKTILFLDLIPTEKTSVYKSENFYHIEWETESINNNEKLKCCITLDKESYKPNNMILKNSQNKIITEAKVQNTFEHQGIYIPQKIKISWMEENIEMTWDLKIVETNTNINPIYWIMPNYEKKIDISID